MAYSKEWNDQSYKTTHWRQKLTKPVFPVPIPDDKNAYRFPVSIKGVIIQDFKVALLKNSRDEWELPGGKLELAEFPESCVAREIREELGIPVTVGPLIDTWVFHISEGIDVLIVTFGCYAESLRGITYSEEHKDAGVFSLDELDSLNMPGGYKRSIRSWDKMVQVT